MQGLQEIRQRLNFKEEMHYSDVSMNWVMMVLVKELRKHL